MRLGLGRWDGDDNDGAMTKGTASLDNGCCDEDATKDSSGD